MEHAVCDQLSKEINLFVEWIKTQPQLPHNIKPLVLLNFLKVYDFDQEKAQKLLLFNLKIRNENALAFTDRDLRKEKIQRIMRTMQISFMPHNTDNNRRVIFLRMTDDDPEKFHIPSFLKLISIVTDVRAVTTYPSDCLVDGDISVFDAKGLCFGHLKKMLGSFSLMRPFLKYAHNSLPQVIYQSHLINTPPILTRIMALFRPFMTKEFIETMIFHQGHETLHDYLPRKVIPLEYGGDAGKIDEIYEKTVEIIEQFREYLNDESSWKLSN